MLPKQNFYSSSQLKKRALFQESTSALLYLVFNFIAVFTIETKLAWSKDLTGSNAIAGSELASSSVEEPKQSQETPWWKRQLSRLGLKLGWTWGTAFLDSSSSHDEYTIATGEASLNGVHLYLFSRPEEGWQINPNLGFQSWSSVLRDRGAQSTQAQNLAGRLIASSCEWADGDQPASCSDSTRYQIDASIVYMGIWAGYVSRSFRWEMIDMLRQSWRVGLEVNPFNFIWTQSTINQRVMSDDAYFTWRGGLLLHAEFLLEYDTSGWLLSLASQAGHIASIQYDKPLEFQGPQRCDQTGCSYLRSFTEDTQISMWNVMISLIKVWGAVGD